MYDPKLVRAAMKRQSVTLEELAQRTGMTMTGIHKATSCDGNPTVKTLGAIAKALNLQASAFFTSDLHHSVNESAIA